METAGKDDSFSWATMPEGKDFTAARNSPLWDFGLGRAVQM